MPAPANATYSAAALIAAHTTFRDLIDSGSAAGFIRIRNSTDQLLAQVPLNDPSGSVSGTTGQLTFDITGPDTAADLAGTAAYGEFCNSDGTVFLAVPTQAGTTPVAGRLVMNTLSIILGAPVHIVSATIG
jgi:hypothetical protein